MQTLIWNQLRLLHGLPPSWRFTRTAKKGVVSCRYPREKYQEIISLVQRVSQPIGDIVASVRDARLRNVFTHSRYWLSGTYVIASGGLSPVSRKGVFVTGVSFAFDQVEERYRAAKDLMLQVAKEHAQACKTYK